MNRHWYLREVARLSQGKQAAINDGLPGFNQRTSYKASLVDLWRYKLRKGFTLLEFTKLILFLSSIFVPGSPCPVVSQSKETPVSRAHWITHSAGKLSLKYLFAIVLLDAPK
jgi:hypothetical protein